MVIWSEQQVSTCFSELSRLQHCVGLVSMLNKEWRVALRFRDVKNITNSNYTSYWLSNQLNIVMLGICICEEIMQFESWMVNPKFRN